MGEYMLKVVHRILESITMKVVLVIIILVLPLNLLAIMESNKVVDTLYEIVHLTTQNLADTYIADLETKMLNAQSLLHYFSTKDSNYMMMKLQKNNDYTFQSAKLKFYYNLKNIGSMTDGGDGYFYYMKLFNDILVYDKNPYESERLYQQINNFIQEKLEEGVQSGWHICEVNSHKYLVFIVDSKHVTYGSWLNLDVEKERIEKGLEQSNYVVNFSETSIETMDDSQILINTEAKGIHLTISLDKIAIGGGISIYQKTITNLVLIYLCLIPILLLFLRSLLLRPLNVINLAHKEIQKGNQDFRIEEKGKSFEYQEVFQSFNKMAGNLKKLRIERYESKIDKQEMELSNLQLQIRPHFLLNTFNFIYTLTQSNNMSAIQDIILYLSDYFRYIFRSNKKLDMFTKELKLVEGYVEMISIAYSGNIKVNYEFDPEIMFIKIPPLLIHNFIENAVKYGIKQGTVLHISIMGKYVDKVVTFYIIDDGNGINETTLKNIRKLLNGEISPDNKNSHIGILNSYRRLKYFYGEDVILEITSEKGMTCIELGIPYDLEDQDEIIDC